MKVFACDLTQVFKEPIKNLPYPKKITFFKNFTNSLVNSLFD